MNEDNYYEITVKDYGKEHVSFGVFKGEAKARELTDNLIGLLSVQEVHCSLCASVPARRN